MYKLVTQVITVMKTGYKTYKGTEMNLDLYKQSQVINKDMWEAKNTILILCISQFQQCPSPPPGQPRGICSRCQSRGWGIRNFIAAQGLGICVPRGDPRAFDTRVLESAMDEFIGKEEVFVEHWLVRQGLEKLADVFKGMFSQI